MHASLLGPVSAALLGLVLACAYEAPPPREAPATERVAPTSQREAPKPPAAPTQITFGNGT